MSLRNRFLSDENKISLCKILVSLYEVQTCSSILMTYRIQIRIRIQGIEQKEKQEGTI